MKALKKFHTLFLPLAFLLLVVIAAGFLSKESTREDVVKTSIVTKEIYPECIAGLCPTYSQIDANPTNRAPETAIIIPLAMTQGFGKLVIVEEGGKKIFDSGGSPGIWVEPVADGNGFILKYSSAVDENMKRKHYEERYVYKNGQFVRTTSN
jgi:hypothetical protein